MATGDDTAVFNGYCGAESGFVPVSAVSPSILVSEIEVEKRAQETDRPPLLPPPDSSGSVTEAKREDASGAWGKDPTLQAMADELARSRSQLKMDAFAPPYFIAYTAQDADSLTVAATMGALLDSSHDHGTAALG